MDKLVQQKFGPFRAATERRREEDTGTAAKRNPERMKRVVPQRSLPRSRG